ncbi:hypothetical protein [Agromyces sp. Marseille-Q5079]|uniref:hypothetical protein n=1 Tax=Agromyces sp. Marseille-Q5079 TaxID=3439059 RepID=UPI003D9CBE5D
MPRETVAVVGAEQLLLSKAVRRAASVPDDLLPRRMFTAEQIRESLPEPGGFGWKDLRVSR